MESVDVFGRKIKIENKVFIIDEKRSSDESSFKEALDTGWVVASVVPTNNAFCIVLQRQTVLEEAPLRPVSPFADLEDDIPEDGGRGN